MKLIKTKPRFKCDFCNRTGVAASIEKHEKICWRNPNRYCESCENTGYYYDDINEDGSLVDKQPCFYCKQYDPTKVPPLEPLKELTTKTGGN